MTYSRHDCAPGFDWIDIRQTNSDCPRKGTTLALSLRVWKRKRRQRLRSQKIPNVRLRKIGIAQSTIDNARDASPSRVRLVGFYALSMHQTKQQRISQLWRPGHSRMRRMEQELRRVLARYGTDVAGRPKHRAHQRQWRLRAQQLHLGANVRAGEKPSPSCAMARSARAKEREIY